MRKWSNSGVFFLAACALAVLSCAERASEQEGGSRLVYVPEEAKVDVVVLEEGPFIRQLIANGKAAGVRRADLFFRTDGVVSEVRVQDGMRVESGALLASLESSEKEFSLRSARIEMGRCELELQNVLVGQGYADPSIAPEAVLEMARIRSGWHSADNALRRAETDFAATSLRAPFSGKIANVGMQPYSRTGGSGAFCTIIDDSSMVVEFAVLESEYSFVEKGLKVKVSPFAQPSEVLVGEVISVNPQVDAKGQVTVRAGIPNPGGLLVDGMNVKVTVEKVSGVRMTVPRSAVVIRDNMEVLFRYSGGRAAWTYVNTVMSNGDSFAVEANADRGARLSPGDTVIISGNLNLADGSKVVLRK